MRSIRTRVTVMTVVAILLSVLLVGGLSVAAIHTEGNEAVEREMKLICDNHRLETDEYLNSIEQSVDIIAVYASELLDDGALTSGGARGLTGWGEGLEGRDWDGDAQRALDDYLTGYTGRIDALFRSLAGQTNGLVAYYLRLNPELSRDVSGLLYSKVGREDFEPAEMTDIFACDAGDAEQVGWYYAALERGEASWLEPYVNQGLGTWMASYVAPLYSGDTFVGVVGMDIDMDTLVRLVRQIHVFNTGYAYLTDAEGALVYHPEWTGQESVESICPELAVVSEAMRGQDASAELIRYDHDGAARRLAFSTLSNGMKLVVVAPASEINASWVHLVPRIIGAGAAVVALFVLITSWSMGRIIRPLTRLTEASRHMAEGNYDVVLDYNRKDEVGTLTEAFRQLTKHLKAYISDLNSMAYRDALTGIRNKGAFDLFSQKLNDLIRTPAEQPHEFAVAMLDCDELKEINDEFGHDKGDLYLRNACRVICRTYAHSPVFRVGGDEFVVVLEGRDFENRDALAAQFDREAAATNAAARDRWDRVSISRGVAVYDPARDGNAQDVLKRADELMYEAKRRNKAGLLRQD